MPSYIFSLLAPILAKLGLGLNHRVERVSDAPNFEVAPSTSCKEKGERSTPLVAEHTSIRSRVMQGVLGCYDALKRWRGAVNADEPQEGLWEPDMEKGRELLEPQRLLRAHRPEEKEEEEEEAEDEGAGVEVEADWEDVDLQERVEIEEREEGGEERQRPRRRQQQRRQQQQQRRRREKENAQRQRLHQANQDFTHSVERLQHLAQQMKRDMFERAAQNGLDHLLRVEADLTASLADLPACIEVHLAKWAVPYQERQQSIREEVELILTNPEVAMQRVRGTLEEMSASRRTPEERREQRRRQEREEEKQRQRDREDPQQKARRIMLKSFDRSAHMWRHNTMMLRRVEADRALYAADSEAWSQAQDTKRARWWDELKPEDRSRLQAELDAVNLKYKEKPNSTSARFARHCLDDKARSVVLKRALQARRRQLRRQEEEVVESARLEGRVELAAGAPNGVAASSTPAGAAAMASGQDSAVAPATSTAAADGSPTAPAATGEGDLALVQ